MRFMSFPRGLSVLGGFIGCQLSFTVFAEDFIGVSRREGFSGVLGGFTGAQVCFEGNFKWIAEAFHGFLKHFIAFMNEDDHHPIM